MLDISINYDSFYIYSITEKKKILRVPKEWGCLHKVFYFSTAVLLPVKERSYLSAPVLLNLLNELGKRNNTRLASRRIEVNEIYIVSYSTQELL